MDDEPAKPAPVLGAMPVTEETIEDVIIPLEAARAHLRHWWREPLAGFLALGVGVFDSWHFGRDGGLTASLDEALVVGGIVLIAGSKRLFGATPVGGAISGNGKK